MSRKAKERELASGSQLNSKSSVPGASWNVNKDGQSRPNLEAVHVRDVSAEHEREVMELFVGTGRT